MPQVMLNTREAGHLALTPERNLCLGVLPVTDEGIEGACSSTCQASRQGTALPLLLLQRRAGADEMHYCLQVHLRSANYADTDPALVGKFAHCMACCMAIVWPVFKLRLPGAYTLTPTCRWSKILQGQWAQPQCQDGVEQQQTLHLKGIHAL